jgi:hypothetical protein
MTVPQPVSGFKRLSFRKGSKQEDAPGPKLKPLNDPVKVCPMELRYSVVLSVHGLGRPGHGSPEAC